MTTQATRSWLQARWRSPVWLLLVWQTASCFLCASGKPVETAYYDLLGVSAESFSETQLKKAYRKLALELHPDKQADKSEEEQRVVEQRFAEISAAYDVLLRPETRLAYDRGGAEALKRKNKDEAQRHGERSQLVPGRHGLFGDFETFNSAVEWGMNVFQVDWVAASRDPARKGSIILLFEEGSQVMERLKPEFLRRARHYRGILAFYVVDCRMASDVCDKVVTLAAGTEHVEYPFCAFFGGGYKRSLAITSIEVEEEREIALSSWFDDLFAAGCHDLRDASAREQFEKAEKRPRLVYLTEETELPAWLRFLCDQFSSSVLAAFGSVNSGSTALDLSTAALDILRSKRFLPIFYNPDNGTLLDLNDALIHIGATHFLQQPPEPDPRMQPADAQMVPGRMGLFGDFGTERAGVNWGISPMELEQRVRATRITCPAQASSLQCELAKVRSRFFLIIYKQDDPVVAALKPSLLDVASRYQGVFTFFVYDCSLGPDLCANLRQSGMPQRLPAVVSYGPDAERSQLQLHAAEEFSLWVAEMLPNRCTYFDSEEDEDAFLADNAGTTSPGNSLNIRVLYLPDSSGMAEVPLQLKVAALEIEGLEIGISLLAKDEHQAAPRPCLLDVRSGRMTMAREMLKHQKEGAARLQQMRALMLYFASLVLATPAGVTGSMTERCGQGTALDGGVCKAN